MEPIAKRRRWLQFSLRTLLVATLLIGAAAGWFGRELRRAKRQAAAVDELVRQDVQITFSDDRTVGSHHILDNSSETTPEPNWSTKWLGVDLYARATAASIHNTLDRDLTTRLANLPRITKYLEDLSDLEEVSIDVHSSQRSLELPDEVAEHVASLRRLTRLMLRGNVVHFTVPPELRWHAERHLDGLKLTADSWSRLANRKQIELLLLVGVELNDHAMRCIASLPNLRTLQIETDSRITDEMLREIGSCKSLEQLTLKASQPHPTTLVRISALPNLRELSLRATMSPEELRSLSAMRELRKLDLMGTTDVKNRKVLWHPLKDDELLLIASPPNLEDLQLRFFQIRQSAVDRMTAAHPNLKFDSTPTPDK